MNKSNLEKYGISAADIMIPKENPDKFAVVACDQFTSQPEYWKRLEDLTKGYPTALKLMMPEAWLFKEEKKAHEEAISQNMENYLIEGAFEKLGKGFIYVERETSTGIRKGLIANINLDCYEYAPGNKALIRATEHTVEERLPARIEIRKKAKFEMPHVMVLFSDPENILLGSIKELTCSSKAAGDEYSTAFSNEKNRIGALQEDKYEAAAKTRINARDTAEKNKIKISDTAEKTKIKKCDTADETKIKKRDTSDKGNEQCGTFAESNSPDFSSYSGEAKKIPVYDFNLLMDGGRIRGWFFGKEELSDMLCEKLKILLDKAEDGMLFAVGDGNHSLAAAKKCGDKYAMVELVNLYDEALVF